METTANKKVYDEPEFELIELDGETSLLRSSEYTGEDTNNIYKNYI